jgi:signal transduction histidine kinase
LPDLFIEILPVHSRIRFSIGVMSGNELNIDGIIRHFAEMTECDSCQEKSECDEKFGPLKALCGVDFIFTDNFHKMRIDDLMFFIQKEYIIKEKEGLIRLNQELEKQVKGKTGQRREQDIQLLELQQRQLVQADKMASIGVMVVGVAHELNNPLSIVVGDIYLVTRDISDLLDYINYLSGFSLPSDVSEDIEKRRKEIDIPYIIDGIENKLSRCKDAAERAKEIVQQFKDFSHLDKGDKVPVDINKGIESTLQIIPRSIKKNMNITTELAPLPEILCYGRQINQVFLNMIINACHAMGNDGELKIETSADDNYIYTKFCDNGHGIPEETINQIFDPFFTTKKVGEGTGLGLSISYSIIEKHGGNITVANNDDKGVTFTIKLLKEGVK